MRSRVFTQPGSFASLLANLQHVRYPAHLGPEIDVADDGIGVIQAPEPERRIMRYELTDFEWTAISPFLPNKPRGVPRVNDRRVLNGIFWILRSGAPWRDLPEGSGPYTTCYNRFVRWRTAGIWDLIMGALAEAHDGSVQMIDTSIVRVHQHGGCAGGSETRLMGRSGISTTSAEALLDRMLNNVDGLRAERDRLKKGATETIQRESVGRAW
jgi:transposase